MFRTVALQLLLVFSTFVFAWGAEPTAGKQSEQSMQRDSGDVPYLLYLPKGYDEEKEKQWPLMLFLHGRGESYGPLDLVTKWGPPKFAKRADDLPYILVSPQCPKNGFWNDEIRQAGLLELLDVVSKSYRVDTDRVMLTGLSMGGFGSWRLAADHPKRFSCVVPVCGAGKTEDGSKLKTIPIWVFHGDKDGAVPFERSVKMVDAIKAAGGTKVRFTSLENVGHNSWSSTYALPELYTWMLKQKASAN
jgi:predicted peptidase